MMTQFCVLNGTGTTPAFTDVCAARPRGEVPMARTDDEMTVVDFPRATPASRTMTSRARNSFPPPPADRPRVFDRAPDVERTSLRPCTRDERTELRPTAAAVHVESAAPIALPTCSTSPVTAGVRVHDALREAASRHWSATRVRVAALAVLAVIAPVVAALVVLGTEERSSARVSFVPPITEQVMRVAARITLGEVAAHAESEAAVLAPAPLPVPIAQGAPVPTTARDAPVRVRAPLANAFAMAAVARPMTTPLPPVRGRAVAPAATSEIELPQSQAADALARAQLEAALR